MEETQTINGKPEAAKPRDLEWLTEDSEGNLRTARAKGYEIVNATPIGAPVNLLIRYWADDSMTASLRFSDARRKSTPDGANAFCPGKPTPHTYSKKHESMIHYIPIQYLKMEKEN